jgi:leucyl aminopeptidase
MEILKNTLKNENNSPLVVGIFEEDLTVKIDEKIDSEIEELIREKQIKKGVGNVNKIYTLGKLKNKVIYLIGLGKEDEFSYKNLEKATRNIGNTLDEKLIVLIDSFVGKLDLKKVVKQLVLTTDYYDYSYDECKSQKVDKKLEISFQINQEIDAEIEEYFKVSNAISNTRDLVNKPYNYLNANDLAEYAKTLVKSFDNPAVQVNILEKPEIEKQGMGAFLGVNQGSSADPKLIHITYQGKDNFNDPIALVGKGVMFDTGGYTIKQSMNNMKDDMGGAATVLGVLEACVKNKIAINLQVVICATDNRINGGALLPDDVLTAMNKKTIEIVSTDAEGRLTLADALCYAQKEGSKTLIDLATLTGACVVALGEYTTGIFGNNKEMINDIINHGNTELEEVWELPITDNIREKVRGSKVADLTNSTGRYMGASGAAAFLEEFIEKGNKWVHLDIAGTSFRTSPSYGEFYGASGVMVKTLYKYLKTISKHI